MVPFFVQKLAKERACTVHEGGVGRLAAEHGGCSCAQLQGKAPGVCAAWWRNDFYEDPRSLKGDHSRG